MTPATGPRGPAVDPGRRASTAYGLAVGAVVVAAGLTRLLQPLLGPSVSPLFFAAVVVSSWYGGLGPGLLATALAVLISELYFFPPLFELDWGTLVRTGTFVFVALLVSSLNERARTAQRHAEELARAREALLADERAARTEAEAASRAKDEFLATLSHELRTPLNAMLGWVWWLRQGTLEAAQAARALETIDRNTKSLAQLIEDLLDVSRIVKGRLRLDVRPTDLCPVIEAAIEAVTPMADARRIRLDVRLETAAATVPGDPERLQQILWNLLSNAIKFTPEGGQVETGLTCEAPHAVVRVRDTGPGIPPALLPHIFESFRQGDSADRPAQAGLGLGLAIVRHLVEMHGGSVEAESAGEGLGSTFTVRLPLERLDLPSEPAAREAAAGARVGVAAGAALDGVRVLVVDDHADARDLLAEALRQVGARVTTAATVREALDALGRQIPDVLVSDLRMPGEDGYDLIQRVRKLDAARGGHIPAVALTAYPRVEDRARALVAGYDMHVPKPIDPPELVTVVKSLVGRPEGSPR